MTLVEQYQELTAKSSVSNYKEPTAYLPKLTNDDYSIGVIVRSFCQKINDKKSPIIEISQEESQNTDLSEFYTIVSLRWRITGPLNPVYSSSGILVDKGVVESNRLAIKNAAATKMPNLKNYLGNLIQFHKK